MNNFRMFIVTLAEKIAVRVKRTDALAGAEFRPWRVSFVLVLLFTSGPAAIFRRVRAIVVDAFNRHSIRSRSHVSDEIGESAPTLADGNAASTIMLPTLCVWIRATLEQINPSVVFRRVLTASRSAMHKVLRNHSVVIETSAASRVAVNEMIAKDRNGAATFTSAIPFGLSPGIARSARFNGQTSKPHANQLTASHGYILPRRNEMTIQKMFTRAAAFAVLALCLGGIAHAQQQNLTQTTLTSAVSGPSLYSGGSPTISGFVTLAACTGVVAPILPGTPTSVIYVGREAMGVFTVNSTTCQLGVFRGYLGTQAAPHPSGEMVLVAPAYQTTLGTGGNPVPNGLFPQDPPQNGTCTAANTTTSPWVNVLTGNQWLCSSVTGTFVPGFNNPLSSINAGQTTTVAAATGAVLPSGPLFIISGAGAISGFTIPVGCDATAVGACEFTVIAAAGSTWTWTAAGNIMTAGTGTAGHTFIFTWSASLSKFVPSALT